MSGPVLWRILGEIRRRRWIHLALAILPPLLIFWYLEAFYSWKLADIYSGLPEFTAAVAREKFSGCRGFSSLEIWSVYFISIFSGA